MRKAAAVIIGVDKTGGLDPLKSAARGAQEVASWLKAEGFDVECLTDDPATSATPVTASAVSAAITKFATKPATYDLLVVYFSGHGQWHTRADHWLLSGAPQNTAEAINLEGAIYTARKSGIPNVIFISDACRTIPRTEVDSLVMGVDAFPNNGIRSASKIDYFKATSEARPAWELPIDGKDQSVLTRAILSAFENPDPQIVKQIGAGGQTIQVVPNRLLETVLQARVDKLLDGVDGDPTQDIETNVPSADDVYIARVRPKTAAAQPGMAHQPPVSHGPSRSTAGVDGGPSPGGPRGRKIPGHAAANAISQALSGTARATLPAGVNHSEIDARTPDPRIDHFETETGFVIRGARVVDAAISPRTQSSFDVFNDSNDPRGDAVRINPGVPAQSVLIVLHDGRSVVLPALRGYLAHALFDENGLANVSYVPSSNSRRWNDYNVRREDIDRFRALVAVAVERNTFRVRSERDAIELAQRIRVVKSLDPTLGLYAAYAFVQAGIDAQVRDIAMYMREDLQADLFDVAMLAGYAENPPANTRPPVPFCPLLTQGWNLLRAYDVTLPDVLTAASRFLSNSLWSTFTKSGTPIIKDAITSGALQ